MGGEPKPASKGASLSRSARFAGKTGPACPGRFFFAPRANGRAITTQSCAPDAPNEAPLHVEYGSKPEPRQRALDAPKIARPEQPDMHQRRVEIVEIPPQIVEARRNRG